MDDRMRVSDADREQVTARLREHFAEGRLTQEELNERITATLSAKTFGDLRRIMADLPEAEPAGAQAGPAGAQAGPGGGNGFGRGPAAGWGPVYGYRRGPRLRLLPLALFLFFLLLIMPGAGWVLFGIFKFFLLLWLIVCLAGIFTAVRFRRRMRRHWHSHGSGSGWGGSGWGGPGWRGPGSGGAGSGSGGADSGGGSSPWQQNWDD
jgi:uncharacterized protein DUF1707